MPLTMLLALRIPDFEAVIRKAVDPAFAGRPVAVATSFKPLGRIVAACPKARAAGVVSDMHYPVARERCPDAAFFVPDRQLAARAAQKLMGEALRFSPAVEPAGRGCLLLDTRGTERLWGGAAAVAERLQGAVRERLRLPAAAGLSVRRPWSLLASRAAGDGGVCVVPPGTEDAFLDRIPVAWIDGIAPSTRARLLELNIRAAGQLRQFSRDQVFSRFGAACGGILWSVLHPRPWDAPLRDPDAALADEDDAVRVDAFIPEATAEGEALRLATRELAVRAASSLRSRGLGAARLRLTLLHSDGVVKSAARRAGGYIQEQSALTELARALLDRVFARRVRVSRLWLAAERLAAPERQGTLFPSAPPSDYPGAAGAGRRHDGERLLSAVDSIHGRFGDASLFPAAFLDGARERRPASAGRRVS